jgi:hypothetical protein
MSPSESMMMRVSLILPPCSRSMTMPQTFTDRPVAGTPRNSPRCVPVPLETGQHLVPLGNLLLDGEVQVRKSSPHTTQNIFQTFQAWTLAGKRNVLQHILPDELNGGIDLTLIDSFFNEVSDDGAVVLYQLKFPLQR